MKPVNINPNLVKLTSLNREQSIDYITKCVEIGSQVTVASEFLTHISQIFGCKTVEPLVQFFSEYLGTYPETWISNFGIRFCHKVGDCSHDGIQIIFERYDETTCLCKLQRLTSIFDVTTFSIINQWKI